MSGSARLAPATIATGQSLAANFTSAVSTWVMQDNVDYQINVTTTDSSGNFFLQVSLDGSNWTDVGPCGTIAAASDTILVEYNQAGSYKTRIRYAAGTAGTGTCNILVSAKAMGS